VLALHFATHLAHTTPMMAGMFVGDRSTGPGTAKESGYCQAGNDFPYVNHLKPSTYRVCFVEDAAAAGAVGASAPEVISLAIP
jgi:hypothetical protein